MPEGMCVHVNPGKPRDQALEVFDHFNIQVTPSDIFTRCQVHMSLVMICSHC